MDNWSSHPAIADDEGPHTPIIPETNVTETMRFRDRIASFLESRAPRCTASAIEGVSRPASALSARSSIHVGIDAPISNSGSVPSDDIADVLKRDESACRLCGAVAGNQQPLKVARLIWQTNEEDNSLIQWLDATRSLTGKIDRNDQSNLLTLCLPHAQSYIERKWRFCPIQSDLEVMILSDQEDQHACQSALDERRPPPAKVHPSFSGCFEVFVLTGDPPIFGTATIQESAPTELEHKIFRVPGINPYLVIASCLEVATEAYHPIGDRSLNLDTRLAFVRDCFNKRSTLHV